jgi:PAP2 superfamily
MVPPIDARTINFITRVSWTIGLGAVWAVGYFIIGNLTPRAAAFDPSVMLDAWIPFVGWAIWPYLLGIVGIASPACLIHSPGLFFRIAVAFAMVIALSFLCFLLLPTDATNLRQHASTSGLDSPTAWAINTLHAIDPPTDLLPSLHVSLATLAAIAFTKEYAAYRTLTYVGWAIMAACVCAVKQHSIIDAVSGVILALAAFEIAGNLVSNVGREDSQRLPMANAARTTREPAITRANALDRWRSCRSCVRRSSDRHRRRPRRGPKIPV